ncbi:MAG: hypothetical protein UHD09_07270 [Bifidobacterium sp.]|nr:hypothetical protein [Bifidobacterium sp.]
MSRPRYGKDDERALGKLERAFWQQLAAVPYTRMNVRRLCVDAGLNKNTFYYYFSGLDDLAGHCIADALPAPVAHAVFREGGGAADVAAILAGPDMRSRVDRLAVLLGRNGEALTGMTVERMRELWRRELADRGIAAVDADGTVRVDDDTELLLGFLAGGLVATMRGVPVGQWPERIGRLLQSPPARGIAQALSAATPPNGREGTETH